MLYYYSLINGDIIECYFNLGAYMKIFCKDKIFV